MPYTRTDRFDFSGVLATALAFGNAIVVSDVGGLSEVAAAGAARMVEPGEPEQLRAVLAELIEDRPQRQRLAAAARAAGEGEWSWDAAARATLELYATILRS